MKTSERTSALLPGQQLRRRVAELGVGERDAAERVVLQGREEILRLPDARARNQQPLAIVVGRDPHDVGTHATEQPLAAMEHPRGLDELRQQPRQAWPRHRAGGGHHLAQALALDVVGDEIHEVGLFAVVPHLDDRGVRDLQRLRLAHEAGARPFPVALVVAPEEPDRHRVAERAVRPAVHHAIEPAAADALAEIVGRQQAARRRRRPESPSSSRRRRRAGHGRSRRSSPSARPDPSRARG